MAFGTREHVFGNTGQFTDDGTWTTGTNWANGAAPLDGEAVVISDPDFDIAGFPADPALLQLSALAIASTCTKKIGTAGVRMNVDCTDTANGAGVVLFEGAGETNYFACNANYFIINHRTYTVNSLFLKHRTTAIGDVWHRDGSATLDGGSYTRIIMDSKAGASSRLVIDAGSTLAEIICASGIIECSATDAIATLTMSGGGIFEHLAVQAITTLNVWGGFFYFDGLSTITEINQWGGVVDASRTTGNKTVTKYNGHAGRLIPPPGGGLSVDTKNFSSRFDRGGF